MTWRSIAARPYVKTEQDGAAGDITTIPHDLTEDYIRADYMRSSIAYTLYILNPVGRCRLNLSNPR
jgi:hypothetical protein